MALALLTAEPALAQAPAASNAASVDIEKAWNDLDAGDPATREAARKQIEAQPLILWTIRALGETRPWASIEALRALCEACPASQAETLRPHLCEGVTTLRIEEMSADQVLSVVQLAHEVCTRFGAPTDDERRQMIDLWTHLLPRFASRAGAKSADPALGKVVSEIEALIGFLSKP